MDVFILKYDVEGQSPQEPASSEIISVFSTYDKGSKAFNFYVDAIEKTWREEDSMPSSENTFNRFSEPHDNVICNAFCQRSGLSHVISLLRLPLE